MNTKEKERLQILMQCSVLDSELNEADYTSITSAATRLLKVPMASVTMIAADRVWFKSTFGFSLAEMPRRGTFADTVSELSDPTDMFVVLDAQQNEAYRDYPPVKNPPYIRFYAGTPIVVEGHIVGSLCTFDPRPRKRLTISERMNLLDLAHATSILLKERRNRVISNTSAVDRLVSHLLHDSLSLPLQEMNSSLSLLRPITKSSSTRSSRSSSRDESLLLSESQLRQSQHQLSLPVDIDDQIENSGRSILNMDSRSVNDGENSKREAGMSRNASMSEILEDSEQKNQTQQQRSQHCDDSMHDVYVALTQLSSLIGTTTSANVQSTTENESVNLSTTQKSENNLPSPSNTHHRIQIPLRFTTSSNSAEYLDQFEEEPEQINPFSLKNCLTVPSTELELKQASEDPQSAMGEISSASGLQQIQRLPTFSSYVYSNMSSDLNEMLTYLQQVLPVSVSNYRTKWKIVFPPNLFNNKYCSSTRCIVYLMDVLTNILETIMTHIIMRTNQMEVTVKIEPIPCGNGIEPEYLPTNSKGYLLNETTIVASELIISLQATGYLNTFYGGHITVEPTHSTNENENTESKNEISSKVNSDGINSSPDPQYDFFIDGVSIEEILSPLGVQTNWDLNEKEESQSPSAKLSVDSVPKKPISFYERNPGVLHYSVTVPCRVEMTYLPPEEVERMNQNAPPPPTHSEENSDHVKDVSTHPQSNNQTESTETVGQPIAEVLEPLTKLRVLIVDDSPAIQKILGKWLLRNDCEVTSALNGQLGVEAMQTAESPFDIVFMDFLMPVMDGIEAIRTYEEWKLTSEMGQSGKHNQTLVIGLSATANVDEQQQGIKVGMHYFIQKPADTKLLRVIIDWKLQRCDVKFISQKLHDGVVLN